ncbi:hypothetical protein [Arsenophonus nasoniae]|uniref:Uncharacterized protein n=1 Tax=Arsenophonus nasoniae TaxID=638 RepID=A0AA95GPX6_9GAMM|nr:hypothetical protein [Arsenophonus nasoniae]WGM00901.1 hypothetical protein QE210_13745 [Arsenophonus nasoniae]
MQKKEPEIIANNNTMEEIYQWMEDSLKARKMLDTLKNSVAYPYKVDPKTGEEVPEQKNKVSKYDTVPQHVFNSEKYPISWIIQPGKNEVAFRRVTNGRIDEDYAPVNYVKANVYAAAILNGLQPPRDLRLSDKPIG